MNRARQRCGFDGAGIKRFLKLFGSRLEPAESHGAECLPKERVMLQSELVEETRFSFSHEVPLPPERRKEGRHLTILRVGALIVGDQRELCLIRNISAGGLMVHAYSPLEIGDCVSVELRTCQQVAGRVIWTRDANAGIEFDAPIDVAELLANPPAMENGWRPRMPRVEVDRLATLRAGANTHWVTILDISQGGMKIEADHPIGAIESEVVVTPEGFRPIPATVRWEKDGTCGIKFHQALPFQELIAWLKTEH
jgi:hypothetical protein